VSSESPAIVVYDSAGNQIATAPGTSAVSALNVQGITGGTPITTSNLSVGPTNAVVPADATLAGGTVQALQSGLTPGDLYSLSLTTTGLLRVDGSNVTQPVSGTVTANAGSGTFNVTGTGTTGSPATGIITIQGNASGVPVPISGTVTATNPSVGLTAATPPGSATYMGALVTTAAESGLTPGDMYPLNLTTTGQLRLDGVYPLAAAVATAVDMGQVGGVVTTGLPTYNTATVNALSLTTTGLLRVDGSNVTQPVSVAGTVAVTQSGSWTNTVVQPTASNLNATVVGVGTAGTPSGGVLTIQGVTGMTPISVTPPTSATGTITHVASSITSVTLLSANAARKSATFYSNASTGNLLYIALAATSNTTNAYTIKVWPGSYWELPIDYTGIVTGIWTTASADLVIMTELT
jgi:hypothetical protein